jgi:hypothetical protein
MPRRSGAGKVITAIRLPIRWPRLGFPPAFDAGGVALADGAPAWSWTGEPPALGIATFPTPAGLPPSDGWGIDHVVLLVPDLDLAVLEIEEVGPRFVRRGVVRNQPAAFFRAGPVLEIIEVEVAEPSLRGVALWTAAPLEEVAGRWRSAGFGVSGPQRAAETGRQILVVRDLDAGLAVMSRKVAR